MTSLLASNDTPRTSQCTLRDDGEMGGELGLRRLLLRCLLDESPSSLDVCLERRLSVFGFSSFVKKYSVL